MALVGARVSSSREMKTARRMNVEEMGSEMAEARFMSGRRRGTEGVVAVQEAEDGQAQLDCHLRKGRNSLAWSRTA